MTDDVRRIADAVLYEGYILWPYRRSATKNQRRWTFGGVYPPHHTAAHPDDRALVRTECLLQGAAAVEVQVRFLQVVERRLLDAAGREVEALDAGDQRYLAWDEATERELPPGRIAIAEGTETAPLPAGAGTFVRSWRELRGRVDVSAERVRDGLSRVSVEIENTTPWLGDEREDALRSTFCSLHVVLRAAAGGAFVSLTDPPEGLREEAAACDNVGLWPVLVGARDTILAAPIILEDYPQIAPESPGDLFDATEIDQLLILNVLGLSEEEREEMRATDPRAREILDRCASLSPEELMRLHGAVRESRPTLR